MVSFPRAGLADLARGIRKAGLAASTFLWPPEGQPDRPPYPGLRAMEEVDAAVFFGREASIVRAIDQIRLVRERDVEQLFVILGASGAGKSSFLRAGLLPRLKRDSEHFLVLRPVRPERAAITGAQGLLAERKHGTPAQISLAWLLAQKPWIVPIPGTTKLQRLEENIGATAVELNAADLADIDDATAKIRVKGDRLPEGALAMTGR